MADVVTSVFTFYWIPGHVNVLPRFYISMRQAKVTVWNRRRSITTFPYEMAARKILVNISLSDRLNTEFPGDVLLSATTIQ